MVIRPVLLRHERSLRAVATAVSWVFRLWVAACVVWAALNWSAISPWSRVVVVAIVVVGVFGVVADLRLRYWRRRLKETTDRRVVLEAESALMDAMKVVIGEGDGLDVKRFLQEPRTKR